MVFYGLLPWGMGVTLRPLGFRIFVKPDPVATETASGFLIPDASLQPRMSGTVIAVGPGGSAMRFHARNRALRDACEVVESTIRQWGEIAPLQLVRNELSALIGTSDPERDVHVGDRVYFDAFVGRVIRTGEDDDTDVIELTEDEISAIDQQGVAA